MGQAKARGSKDQRVTEAVERARVAEIAHNVSKEAERKALVEAAQAARAAREKESAERLARGEKPLPKRTVRNSRLAVSTLIAAAGIAMAYR
jgi:hypothetical protein